ncbi:MAG: hypothetical protein KKG47_14770 [Proteobacteria bacterium]|nr:hypothetical protein [Pseudomonadota bacterium]MBU1739845.1 hypothetical protein [Pseudomonadota bacterium]
MLQRINLVPQKPLSETLKVISPLILLLLMGIVLASVFIEIRIIESRIANTEREKSALQEKQLQANIILASKQRLAEEISTLAEQKDKIAGEVAKIESIRSRKRYYTRALNIISGSLPASVKCNRISFQESLGSVEGVAMKYQDLPVLVKDLADDGFIRHAVLNEVDRMAGKGSDGLNFRITFTME